MPGSHYQRDPYQDPYSRSGARYATPKKKPIWKRWWFWLIIVVFVVGTFGSSGQDEQPQQVQDPAPQAVDGKSSDVAAALALARQYNADFACSEHAMLSMLKADYGGNFTDEAAEAAVAQLGADWDANAVKTVLELSDLMAYSRSGMLEAMTVTEDFTEEQALYAVDNAGVSWADNALRSAQGYATHLGLSGEEVYAQLLATGFTDEEAQHAVSML